MRRDVKEFKQRFRFALSLSGKGQNELGREIEASNSIVSDWLDETTDTLPGGAFLIRLPKALGIDGHWFLTGQGHFSDKISEPKAQVQQGVNLAVAVMRQTLEGLTGGDAARVVRASDGARSAAKVGRG